MQGEYLIRVLRWLKWALLRPFQHSHTPSRFLPLAWETPALRMHKRGPSGGLRKYRAWRKVRMRMARRSRRINRDR
jgi:hypothetical protein